MEMRLFEYVLEVYRKQRLDAFAFKSAVLPPVKAHRHKWSVLHPR